MEEYVSLVVSYSTSYYYKNKDGIVVYGVNETEVELIRCPPEKFSFDAQSAKDLGISESYICIKDLNFTIFGSPSSMKNSYVSISVVDCD